ncbi:hypothetical protein [Yersinia enterocolitica]|uniref:hypothetical protein n=1 Tax=Yersinia enterocolitica TaxID=630 RepID=UPI0029B24E22|nr:hypothetical protein [Yersinia enterocolitica]HDL6691843.1 hypothetical protein [Yersinia enterocolitica]HDL8294454.1 hypothetical protein [Yersinia enterocolitica]HDM8419389.1 hypothetical protein [Yersinia enterocolitica]HEI6772368.1 hypothetical protein [Yersinia enterocolitica]
MDEKKIEFLYQSINDTQATIRAIDVKIGFLFVVIFLPLAAIDGISKALLVLWASPNHFGSISIFVGVVWLLSVYFLFKSLSAITDIQKHMIGVMPDDTFFKGGMPFIGMKHLFSIDDVRAEKSVGDYLKSLPKNEIELLSELASEKMKVSLIRNVKALRVKVCTNLTLLWLAFGMFLSVVFLFKIGLSA